MTRAYHHPWFSHGYFFCKVSIRSERVLSNPCSVATFFRGTEGVKTAKFGPNLSLGSGLVVFDLKSHVSVDHPWIFFEISALWKFSSGWLWIIPEKPCSALHGSAAFCLRKAQTLRGPASCNKKCMGSADLVQI